MLRVIKCLAGVGRLRFTLMAEILEVMATAQGEDFKALICGLGFEIFRAGHGQYDYRHWEIPASAAQSAGETCIFNRTSSTRWRQRIGDS